MSLDFGAAWPPATALASAREGRLLTLRPAPGQAGDAPAGSIGMWPALAISAGLGLAWAVVFRVFMRLVSEDPAFSLSGTAFILGYGVLLWSLAGFLLAARDRGWSWPRRIVPAALVVALIAFMTVFAPTMPLLIVPVWLGLSRARWPAPLRWTLVGLAVLTYAAGWIAVLALGEAFHPLSPETAARLLAALTLATAVLLPLYFAFAWAVEPVRRPLPATPAVVSHGQLDTSVAAGRPA